MLAEKRAKRMFVVKKAFPEGKAFFHIEG